MKFLVKFFLTTFFIIFIYSFSIPLKSDFYKYFDYQIYHFSILWFFWNFPIKMQNISDADFSFDWWKILFSSEFWYLENLDIFIFFINILILSLFITIIFYSELKKYFSFKIIKNNFFDFVLKIIFLIFLFFNYLYFIVLWLSYIFNWPYIW